MGIDFHHPSQRLTYARRQAGPEWVELVRSVVDPRGLRIVDLGCGGGVYSTAWLDLGAASVVGVDFSAAMLSGARERCGQRPGLDFRQGEATATGLPSASADLVFARALVHHLPDLTACCAEAARLLTPGGHLLVQDRTMDDVELPGSPTHLRGYLFERFPDLLRTERARRPAPHAVPEAARAAGLEPLAALPLWETRRDYADADEVRADLMARTGRSLLHELDDAALRELADHVADRLGDTAPVRERDHWTVWVARRTAPTP